MYSDLESDEKRRREVASSLYRSLMQNWDIPQSIQDYYGFSEDYRLFHQLEGMDSDVYYRKRETGEVPDILEVDARLTRAVEAVFESVCRRPPAPYLDRLNGGAGETRADCRPAGFRPRHHPCHPVLPGQIRH